MQVLHLHLDWIHYPPTLASTLTSPSIAHLTLTSLEIIPTLVSQILPKLFKALAFPSKHLHLSTLRNFTNFADSSGMTLVWLHSCLSGFELQTLLSTWWSPTLSTVVAVLDPSSTHQSQEGFPQTLLTLWLIDLHSLQDSTSLIYQLKVARLDWLLSYSDFCRDMIIWLAFCCQFATRGKFA